MTKAGKSIIAGAKGALAIARGEAEPVRIHTLASSDVVAARDLNRRPTHPGALLRDEVIPASGKSKAEIARLLGISRQQLYDITEQTRPISATVAVRLGKLFGNGPHLWANMQTAYDVWQAANTTDLSGIPTLEPA